MTDERTVKCPNCGTMNTPDDDFCGNCGEYLGWEGRGTPVPVEVEIAVPATDGSATDGSEGADGPEPPAAPDTIVETVGPPEPEPADVLEPSVGKEVLEPERPNPQPEPERQVQPEAAQPMARKPEAVPRRPPTRRAARAEDAPRPGELACPNCGAGNSPDRHFCRRCATPLHPSDLPLPAASPQPEAGARPLPRTRRVRPAWIVVPIAILLVAAGAWIARDWIGTTAAGLIDRVAAATPVSPVSIVASSVADGRPAEAAYDGYSNTSWTPAATGPGTGEYVEATFDEPFRLVSLQMMPGASDVPAEFLAAGRPDTVLLTVTRADGTTVERTITVADMPETQSWDLGIDDVIAVRLTIGTAHGSTDQTRTAIAELGFRGR